MPWYRKLGPGLLYAGAAIGVSHLVQSTRAGALYGFDLVLVILVINLIKYPFFEISARYTSLKGQSLLRGYYDISPSFLVIFLLQTFLTMFIVQAAVTVVTSGLLINFLGLNISPALVCFFLFVFLSTVLFKGKLSYLDAVMKPIILLLVLCTILAFLMAIYQVNPNQALFLSTFNWLKKGDLIFLAALVGWMPSPLDGSVWHSLWAAEKARESHHKISIKETLFDLRFSYGLIIVLALVFLSLGALIMHAKGQTFSFGAVAFSAELVGLYRESLGSWSSLVVSLGCLLIMISTTLSCWDAFARTMAEGTHLLIRKRTKINYYFYLIIIALGALVVINFFMSNMKSLVDFATTVAFVVAPLVAFLSLTLMFKEARGNKGFPKILQFFSVLSSFVLLLLSGLYVFVIRSYLISL